MDLAAVLDSVLSCITVCAKELTCRSLPLTPSACFFLLLGKPREAL